MEGTDGQTWRRLKRIAIVVVSLTVFQSSFLLFLAFDIMRGRHICLAQSFDFVIYD